MIVSFVINSRLMLVANKIRFNTFSNLPYMIKVQINLLLTILNSTDKD